MHTLYGIKNCDTVKKARLWLDQHDIAYRFHDFRSDGLTPELLTNLIARSDWQTLLNRNSTSWRQLSDAQKADLTGQRALQLMLNTPTLIKRPVLDTGDQLVIGFKDGIYAAYLSGTGPTIAHASCPPQADTESTENTHLHERNTRPA
ncbi:MAG: ArsC family reductase [Methylovulum sp.]|nr:ArsC family reductase [Methylovulum sp.]